MARKLAAKDYMKNFVPPAKKLSVNKPSPATQKSSAILKEVQNKVNDVSNKKMGEPSTSEQDTDKKPKEKNVTSNSDVDSQPIVDSQLITDSDLITDSQLIIDSQMDLDSQPNQNTKLTDTLDSQLNDDLTIENFSQDDFFADDMDVSQIEEDESQPQNNAEENLADVLQSEFMNEWNNLTNQDFEMEVSNLLTNADIPLIYEGDKQVSTDCFMFLQVFFIKCV